MRKAFIKLNPVITSGLTTYVKESCIINGKDITSKNYIDIKRRIKSYNISDQKQRDPNERLAVIKAQTNYAKKYFNSIMTQNRKVKIKLG